jgi:hypothetical protein
VEYRKLGRTRVTVSSLCLGATMFGEWGTKDHDDSVRVIHRALDAGVTFVDTADAYSAGESEEIVGKALRGRRDGVVLAATEQAALKCLYLALMSLDPTGKGRQRWTNRWKAALNAFDIAFDGRLAAGRS